MWYAIIGSLAAATLLGVVYISFRAANFAFVKRISGGRRRLGRLICLVFFACLFTLLWLSMNMMNALVCTVHLVVFWLIADAVALIFRKATHRKKKRYIAGGAAVVLCALYLAAGWYSDHHVSAAHYSFETDKLEGSFRIVQITDSHIGATFHADGFLEYIKEINALEPDVVAVTGDFVDDDTSRRDMLGGCEALGELKTRYGVFFVYGNHDRGYFSEEAKGWKNSELKSSLRENGVTILEDASCPAGESVYIVGRQDRYVTGRASAEELLSGLDNDKYVIMLDHQPFDFDGEAEAGADLVLCGHTHGGQFIPINHVGERMGENCLNYGHERRQNTDFIVSSGISNWSFRFKTGCHSEYVVIDIKGK